MSCRDDTAWPENRFAILAASIHRRGSSIERAALQTLRPRAKELAHVCDIDISNNGVVRWDQTRVDGHLNICPDEMSIEVGVDCVHVSEPANKEDEGSRPRTLQHRSNPNQDNG